MRCFCRILAWSLYWSYLGRWPTHDWNGREYTEGSEACRLATDVYWLAGGFAAVFFSLESDLDCFYKTWRLENHGGPHNPCCWCPASLASDNNWRDVRPSAGWIGRCYTAASWTAAHPDPLELFLLFFVTTATINPDWMHVKYLGVDQYLFASALKILTHHHLPNDPDVNMALVMRHLKEYFNDNNVRNAYQLITTRMYCNKDTPKLKGRASEIRHLGKALHHVFNLLMDHGDTLHKEIKATLKLNTMLEDKLDCCDEWNFQGQAYDEFLETAHMFCGGYNTCAATANSERGLELFPVTIKLHHLLHCVLRSQRLHPKASWCFKGEAFMKVSKQLHMSCTRGLAQYAATVKVASKMLTALHYQFSDIAAE